MSVVKKAKATLKLTKSAEGRLQSLLSQSFQLLKTSVSDASFTEYMITQEDEEPFLDDGITPNPNFVEYIDLTESQLLRRTLEQVQAYYLLYFAIPSLKEVDLGAVMSKKEEAGQAQTSPTDMQEIFRLANKMKAEGDALLLNTTYRATSNFIFDVI